MKFTNYTILLIIFTIALAFAYMNIERFIATIVIPDAPAGPPGPPGPPGPGSGSTSSAPATVATGKSIKGPEFAKLTPSSSMGDRLKAFMTDKRVAASAAGEVGATKCTDSQKGGYTSECKITGFCDFGGYCDGNPEDALAYGLIDQAGYTQILAMLRK